MGKALYPHDLLVKGGKARGLQQQLKTRCPKGHPYDEANTMHGNGRGRSCRICHNATARIGSARRRSLLRGLAPPARPPKAEAHTSQLGTMNR